MFILSKSCYPQTPKTDLQSGIKNKILYQLFVETCLGVISHGRRITAVSTFTPLQARSQIAERRQSLHNRMDMTGFYVFH